MNNTMTVFKYSPGLLSLSHDVSHPWRQKGHISCTFQCYKFTIKAQISFLALTKNCWTAEKCLWTRQGWKCSADCLCSTYSQWRPVSGEYCAWRSFWKNVKEFNLSNIHEFQQTDSEEPKRWNTVLHQLGNQKSHMYIISKSEVLVAVHVIL